ncbi:MAG: PAS domain S-box protein, partial [Polyangiaceae bacterium]
DGSWQYLSPAATRIFGRSHEELIGKRVVDIVHPDDREMVSGVMQAIRKEPDTTIAFEVRVLQPSGDIRWVACTSTNLIDDPAIKGVVSNVRDSTESRTAAEALRVSEDRFAKLARSGVIGVVTVSTDGRILDGNESWLEMVGYSLEDFSSGRVRWPDLTPPDIIDDVTAWIAQLREQGVALAFETVVLAKNGTRVPMLVGAAMIDKLTCVAFCADLTEKKRTEEMLHKTEEHLRQAQKMEAVGRLAGGVAHDFNNLLSVILSYSEVLLLDLEDGNSMRDDVEEIRKAGERAADLTRQLLMFSRRQVLAPRILDLNGLLTEMMKMLNRVLGEDIDLSLVRGGALGRVKADPTSLEQVIMNLVVNARDAMPTGGTLTIETSNIVLDEAHAQIHACKHSGPHVMLNVTDTGTGMDEATQLRIFEPFFTTKTNEKGTGLGLSTVFGIVEQSNGCVWVESALGKGTTFKICLPSEAAPIDRARPPASPTTSCGTETILLVEDEEQVRVVVRDILQRHGYQVLEASNAGEALLACEKHVGPIHLLLSDVVMPHMSGPELGKRLCSMRTEMRLLFMSGYTDDSIVRHGILNSDIAFLQKPLTPSTLARKVRDVLDAPPSK